MGSTTCIDHPALYLTIMDSVLLEEFPDYEYLTQVLNAFLTIDRIKFLIHTAWSILQAIDKVEFVLKAFIKLFCQHDFALEDRSAVNILLNNFLQDLMVFYY
jgi:hypothetical protein